MHMPCQTERVENRRHEAESVVVPVTGLRRPDATLCQGVLKNPADRASGRVAPARRGSAGLSQAGARYPVQP